jgi:hypothetical protein
MARETKIVKVYNPAGLTLLNPSNGGNKQMRKKPKSKPNGLMSAGKNLKKPYGLKTKRRGNPVALGDSLTDAAGLIGGMLAVNTVSGLVPFGKGNLLIDSAIKIGLGYGASILAEKISFTKRFSRGIAISGAALALQAVLDRFAPNLSAGGGRLRPMRIPKMRRGAMPATPVAPAPVPVGSVPVAALPPSPAVSAPAPGVSDWYYDDGMGNWYYDDGMGNWYYDNGMMDEFQTDAYFMNDLVTDFPYIQPRGLSDLVENFNP